MTLAEFLLARIAEDEAAATRAKEMHGEVIAMWSGYETDQDLTSVGDYSADRVLAECEAKRRIVNLHGPWAEWCGWSQDANTTHSDDLGPETNCCNTLRALAAPYAAHPEYLDAWRIDTPSISR